MKQHRSLENEELTRIIEVEYLDFDHLLGYIANQTVKSSLSGHLSRLLDYIDNFLTEFESLVHSPRNNIS